MRTLALLAAILLLAPQTQAEPLRERADEVPAQEQPGAEEQPGADDQGWAISFAGDENPAQEAKGLTRGLTCYCRRLLCGLGERQSGSCTIDFVRYKLCCR